MAKQPKNKPKPVINYTAFERQELARLEAERQKAQTPPPDPTAVQADPGVTASAAPRSMDPADPANYRPKMGPHVDLGDLPPEKQAETMEALQQMMSMRQASQDAVAPDPVDLPPQQPGQGPVPAEQLPPGVQGNVVDLAVGQAASETAPQHTCGVCRRPHYCPNCGFDTAANPTEITDDDRRDFYRFTLSGRCWEKTYPLFQGPDGMVQVTFRARDWDAEEMIKEQLMQEIGDRRLLLTDPALAASNYAWRYHRLQLTASLASINGGPIQVTLPPLTSEPMLKKYKPKVKVGNAGGDTPVAVAEREIYKGWPAPLYSAVFNNFTKFEALNLRLLENANRPDFWQEIAGQV